MANEKMNNFIRRASGYAPLATEQPQTPRTPTANAGAGSGQTGVYKVKQSFNTWLRQSGRGNKF